MFLHCNYMFRRHLYHLQEAVRQNLKLLNILLRTTNKMQQYSLLLSVLYMFQAGFSAHHQELKNCTCIIGYLSNLFFATSNVGEMELTSAVTADRFDKFPMVHVKFLSS